MINKSKRSRKYLSIILALVLVFSMSPFAFGLVPMGITVGTNSGLPGDTLSVDINISNIVGSPGLANGLYNGNFKLTYDSSALTLGTITRGPLLPTPVNAEFSTNTTTPGQITFLYQDSTGGDYLINSNGVFATVQFTIKADAAPGDYPIAFATTPLLFNGLNTTSYEQTAISTLATDGTITVQAGPTAPYAANVDISGDSIVGEILTGSYSYFDDNGDAESGTTYQWYRCDTNAADDAGTAITGATALTYQLVAADAGKYLKFGVTPKTTVAPTTGTEVKSPATNAVIKAADFVPGVAEVQDNSTVSARNLRAYILFDEGVYGDAAATTAIDINDFDLTYSANGSPLTNVTISSMNNSGNTAPAPGNSGFFLFLSLTGNNGKALGTETITITPKANSIYNIAGIATPATATTGPLYLNDTMPQAFTAVQGADNPPGSRYVSIFVDPEESGGYLYVVVLADGATAPSSSEVMALTGAGGASPVNSVSASIGNTGMTWTAGLTADNTPYDAYIVVADAAGNASDPYLLNVTTPRAVSTDATVTSAVYTVSAGGTANETISSVPFGTSKTDFLANLTKGFSEQTWNTTSVLDPVIDGDLLIVTAEDGTTVVNYEIAVDPQVMVSTINVTGTGGATTMLDNAHSGSLQMLAEVLPANAYNKAVTWSVINGTGSAYINPSTGLLNQGTVGTVTVRATAQDGSAVNGDLEVTVIGVRMSIGGVSMYTTRTYQLSAEAVPNDAAIAGWSSNNPGVASVDSNGLVTANAVGSAIIRAYTADGREGFTTITVTPEPLATLDDLTISEGTLTPAFAENTYNYTARVSNSITTITVTATPYAGTTVTGDGTYTLVTGTNTIQVVVSGDDYTTATYTIVVTRSSSGGGGGGGGGGSDNGETIDGDDGGNISDDDNGLELDFPDGVMEDDFTVTIVVVGKTGLNVPSDSRIIGRVISITKDLAGDFDEPVTITLDYDPAEVDFNKVTLSLYYYDSSKGKWFELDNVKIDKVKHTVSGQVSHFTNFAILATDIPTTTPPVNPPATPSLTDVSGHWAADSITKLVNSGAIAGYPDNTFRPDASITRAEFASILVKAFNLAPKEGKVFADTANHWAKANIATAQAYGIINGYSDTKFGPDDKITREQMAIMIAKAANLAPAASARTFKDSAKISSWAKEAVATAVANGIIAGYPDDTFQPQGSATRAEAVTVIVKAMK